MNLAHQRRVFAKMTALAPIVILCIHFSLFPMYTSSPPAGRTIILAYEHTLCETKPKCVRFPLEWRSPCPNYGIVSVVQGGRLGNQIWEYASVWATAKKTGLKPFMPRCILETLEAHFENLSITPLSYIGNCTLDDSQVVDSLKQWNSTEQSIIIPRYAAHWSLIFVRLEDFRREFTFKPNLRVHAEMMLRGMTARFNLSEPTYIGVHVRRTDFVGWLWRKLKVRPAPISYYFAAMDYFNEKYNNVIFVVASDDITWCMSNFRSSQNKLCLEIERTRSCQRSCSFVGL